MHRTSRQIARVHPRRAVALFVVAVLAVACTSEPSPAEKSSAAKQDSVAQADLRAAVKAIKLCVKDSDGEYPPAIKNQTGSVTMLCGPVGQSVQVSRGDHLTYAPKDGGFTLEITAPDGSKFNYDSTSSEPSGS